MDVFLDAIHRTAKPDSLDDLLNRLRKNTIHELKLGWHGCDFLHSSRHTSYLTKAIKQNRSVVSVAIGWRHTHRGNLFRVLRALAKTPARLTTLNLVLADWVPSDVLMEILQAQQSLVNIHLSCVQVHTRQAGQWCCAASKTCTSFASVSPLMLHTTMVSPFSASPACDHSPITQCIVHQYHSLQFWKVLSLIDCDLTDADVIQLADFLHIRGGLSELNLRSNRRLTSRSLKMICQAPVMKHLDVSLCELDAQDAQVLGQALQHRPWPLAQFSVAGNYRMGSGVLALTRLCKHRVQSLDVSYCDIKDHAAVELLHSVTTTTTSTTQALESVQLHGAPVCGSDAIATAVQRLLRHGGLRSLALNDPNEPKPMTAKQLQTIVEGLKENYDMTDLRVDTMRCAETKEQLEFWLRLNQMGRGVVRENCQRDWYQVLEETGRENLDSLYWIVRQSPGRFERSTASRKKSNRMSI